MKRVFLAMVMCVLVLGSCTTSEKQGLKEVNPEDINAENPAVITFDEEIFEFGKLVEGDRVEHYFTFTNTGGSRLIIVDANADCGCTVPEWPKEPIEPGETGKIKVTFNSAMKQPGPMEREIRVRANTYPETVTKLKLRGEIVGPGQGV